MDCLQVADINLLILKLLHPYYARNYYAVDKYRWKLVNDNINILMNHWCTKYPFQLNTKQLIETSLFYSPILESKQYYDSLSLIYYSCRNNQSCPLQYMNIQEHDVSTSKVDNLHYFRYLSKVCWIAYKFQRLDILDHSNDLKARHSDIFIMIDILKEVHNLINNKDSSLLVDQSVVKNAIILLCQLFEFTLFSLEEIAEIVIVIHRIVNLSSHNRDITIHRLYGELINGCSIVRAAAPWFMFSSFAYIGQKLGKDKIELLLSKYQINDKARVFRYESSIKDSHFHDVNENTNSRGYRSSQNLENQELAYYLEKGDIMNYVYMRDNGKKLISSYIDFPSKLDKTELLCKLDNIGISISHDKCVEELFHLYVVSQLKNKDYTNQACNAWGSITSNYLMRQFKFRGEQLRERTIYRLRCWEE